MKERRRIVVDEIIEVTRELKEKIDKHRNEFSKSEALVRYALIDPLLRALGWSTEDPEQIRPEYSTGAGRPDYALLRNGKIVAFLGAKALGREEDLNQHISYCVSEGVPYFITTDGNRWEVYDTFRQVKLQEKKITSWEILQDDEDKIAIRSLTIANLTTFGETSVEPLITPKPASESKMDEVKPAQRTSKEAQYLTSREAEMLVLQILHEVNRPLRRTEIINEAEKRIVLTKYDKEILKSGIPRWRATVAWAITNVSDKKYIRSQERGIWIITDEGRRVLNQKQF